jgi:hypothetical protein
MIISKEGISTTELQDYGPNRFIKVPINKFLEVEKIELIPPQLAFINAINNPNYRFITATMSRRTGKTYIANIVGSSLLLVPGSSLLIVAPDYSLATISWDIQRKFLLRHSIEVAKNNAKDRVIELQNSSSVRIASVSKIDSAIGRSYDLIIFDEAAIEEAEQAFNIQLLPTLDKISSKAAFISTPRGRNWFYKFFNRGFELEDWVSIASTWEDNPRTPKRVVDSARATMSKAEFEQEFLCSFNTFEGACWNFSKEDISDLDTFPTNFDEIIAGLDVGFRDPTAFCLIGIKDKEAYILDEYLSIERTTEAHAKNIKSIADKADYIYIDAAAAQTKHDLAQLYDISCINAKKSTTDSIAFVGSLIDNGRLHVNSKCKHSILALQNYSWDFRSTLTKETPKHDNYSHMADAIRYALYTHKANLEIGNEF